MATNKIAHRMDTASNWSTANPTLVRGEWGYESDTGKGKLGDGVTTWNSLSYAQGTAAQTDVEAYRTSTTISSSGTTAVDAPTAYGHTIVNVNAATATITLPSGVPIGGRITIRKIHTAQGTIVINSGGDQITREPGRTSVSLNSNGDFWVLEKVSATRWELVDGVESGSGYYKYNDGVQAIYETVNETFDISLSLDGKFYNVRSYTYPITFVSVDHGTIIARAPSHIIDVGLLGTALGTSTTSFAITSNAAITNLNITYRISISGRWYA